MEFILEMIGQFIVEIIFEIIILGFFRCIKIFGLVMLKFLTLSDKSIIELKEKYKDSSKPYLLGFGFIFGIIYLIIKMVN